LFKQSAAYRPLPIDRRANNYWNNLEKTGRPDKWASIPTIGEIITQSSVYFLDENLRFLKNGEIEFGGRKDGQVKIRGNRVELSEIEIILMKGQISISKFLF
jgi:acyl-coenzyme A synthetase/AMP-(fatty) acid ligase